MGQSALSRWLLARVVVASSRSFARPSDRSVRRSAARSRTYAAYTRNEFTRGTRVNPLVRTRRHLTAQFNRLPRE